MFFLIHLYFSVNAVRQYWCCLTVYDLWDWTSIFYQHWCHFTEHKRKKLNLPDLCAFYCSHQPWESLHQMFPKGQHYATPWRPSVVLRGTQWQGLATAVPMLAFTWSSAVQCKDDYLQFSIAPSKKYKETGIVNFNTVFNPIVYKISPFHHIMNRHIFEINSFFKLSLKTWCAYMAHLDLEHPHFKSSSWHVASVNCAGQCRFRGQLNRKQALRAAWALRQGTPCSRSMWESFSTNCVALESDTPTKLRRMSWQQSQERGEEGTSMLTWIARACKGEWLCCAWKTMTTSVRLQKRLWGAREMKMKRQVGASSQRALQTMLRNLDLILGNLSFLKTWSLFLWNWQFQAEMCSSSLKYSGEKRDGDEKAKARWPFIRCDEESSSGLNESLRPFSVLRCQESNSSAITVLE